MSRRERRTAWGWGPGDRPFLLLALAPAPHTWGPPLRLTGEGKESPWKGLARVFLAGGPESQVGYPSGLPTSRGGRWWGEKQVFPGQPAHCPL